MACHAPRHPSHAPGTWGETRPGGGALPAINPVTPRGSRQAADGVTTTPGPWGARTQLAKGCEPPSWGRGGGENAAASLAGAAVAAEPAAARRLRHPRHGQAQLGASSPGTPSIPARPQRSPLRPLKPAPGWKGRGGGALGVTKAAELCQRRGEGCCARRERAKRVRSTNVGTWWQSQEIFPAGRAALPCATPPPLPRRAPRWSLPQGAAI